MESSSSSSPLPPTSLGPPPNSWPRSSTGTTLALLLDEGGSILRGGLVVALGLAGPEVQAQTCFCMAAWMEAVVRRPWEGEGVDRGSPSVGWRGGVRGTSGGASRGEM